MNEHNKQIEAQLDTVMQMALKHMQIDGKPIDFDKVNVYLTNDPMFEVDPFSEDPPVHVLKHMGSIARYKVIDQTTVYMYAEPVYPYPQVRAILSKEHKQFPVGTQVCIYRILANESSLANARFDVEVIDPRFQHQTIRIHRDDLLLDREAKNIYFCRRQTFRSGTSFDTALVPIERYEYHGTYTKEQVEDAWKMFYAVHPSFAPELKNKIADDILLTFEHPTCRPSGAMYDTLRKTSLQETCTRPVFRDRYKAICAKTEASAEMDVSV